jgi:dihydropteroate synthase
VTGALNRPLLMGILNVTPDSFSDGGAYPTVAAAIEAGRKMIDEGAQIIDVGGESTRPGSEPVPADEELRRTIPVVDGLVRVGIDVSIDTMKAAVAREALAAGASVVNDVTALRDPEMRKVCASACCGVCLMHMQGEPNTMQASPVYDDVVAEVRRFLVNAAARAEGAGIDRERIWIDPGIGFGKTARHNLALLRNLSVLVETGYPVLIGVSRKSFLGKIGTPDRPSRPVTDRLPETLAVQVLVQSAGARIIRAHDVQAARRVIDTVAAVLDP